MAIMRNVLGVLLAGGQGERLWPLTRDRAKPAVPFGGVYRIIDITLSNCLNSDLRRVFVLTQYKALSLNRHVRRGWSSLMGHGDFMEVLPPQTPVSVHGVSGYSGGGKSMIAEFEDEAAPNHTDTPFRVYGLAMGHKHVPEMKAYTGLDHRPVFSDAIATSPDSRRAGAGRPR